jgi:quercetin dioxygenase-like cupin family protein
MRDSATALIAIIITAGLVGLAVAQESGPAAAPPVKIFDSAKTVKWQPAPPMLPEGAQFSVLDGDPMKQGSPFTVRLKMPDGYQVPAHSHPTDENVTVMSGILGAGMGDKLDKSKGQLIRAGGFVRIPQGMHHYAWAKGATVVQIHGTGPLNFQYVNPADDPRNHH